MRFVPLLLVLGTLAGCVEDSPAPGNEAPASESTEPFIEANGTLQRNAAAPIRPFLINVTDELRSGAAEIRVPAGQFHLARLVYDDAVWGSWDGSGSTGVGMAWKAEGPGVYMDAFGFARPSWAADQAFRPWITFAPFDGDGWMGSIVTSSCSGEGCSSPPAHQRAYLLGSDVAPVTFRIGIISSFEEAETLWDRPEVGVSADAATGEAWAGSGMRGFVLATEFHGTSGIVNATWSGTSLPTGGAVERQSTYEAAAEIQAAGIVSVSLLVQDLLGIDTWSYQAQIADDSLDASGTYIHGPLSGLADGTVIHHPAWSYQNVAPKGPFHVVSEHSFVGQSDPVGYATYSLDWFNVGHAGVDPEALYGWDVDERPAGSEFDAACHRTSLLPGPVCIGAPTEIARIHAFGTGLAQGDSVT